MSSPSAWLACGARTQPLSGSGKCRFSTSYLLAYRISTTIFEWLLKAWAVFGLSSPCSSIGWTPSSVDTKPRSTTAINWTDTWLGSDQYLCSTDSWQIGARSTTYLRKINRLGFGESFQTWNVWLHIYSVNSLVTGTTQFSCHCFDRRYFELKTIYIKHGPMYPYKNSPLSLCLIPGDAVPMGVSQICSAAAE